MAHHLAWVRVIIRVGPGQYPQYIRAPEREEAVGSSPTAQMTQHEMSPTNTSGGHRPDSCTQRECQIRKDIVDNYRKMFESRISAGAMDKLSVSEYSDANISSCSYDMEGNEIANWQTKQLNSYRKSQQRALTTANSQKKKMDQLENYLLSAHKWF